MISPKYLAKCLVLSLSFSACAGPISFSRGPCTDVLSCPSFYEKSLTDPDDTPFDVLFGIGGVVKKASSKTAKKLTEDALKKAERVIARLARSQDEKEAYARTVEQIARNGPEEIREMFGRIADKVADECVNCIPELVKQLAHFRVAQQEKDITAAILHEAGILKRLPAELIERNKARLKALADDDLVDEYRTLQSVISDTEGYIQVMTRRAGSVIEEIEYNPFLPEGTLKDAQLVLDHSREFARSLTEILAERGKAYLINNN